MKALMTTTSILKLLGCASSAAILVSAIAAPPGSVPFTPRHKLAPSSVPKHPVPGAGAQFGDPLPGLSANDLADFTQGRDEFEAVETPEGGLGPIFNGSSCAACHSAGGIGGASNETVTRFGRLAGGKFDALAHLGGSLLQARAIDPEALEHVPAEANVVAKRLATPLFGAGLMEAIADADIELNAARPQPDGIRGRALKVLDVASGTWRIGRFGWKSQHATLLTFAGDAYVNEMGVTSRLFPTENAPNGRADLLAQFDKVPDVEDAVDPATGKGDIDHAADFMRLLAPPPAVRATAASLAGERLFQQARCTACHVPVMFTGAHPIAALAHQPARLYSDLLLHDMGRLGDGIEQDGAKGREMRTAPLWGLRARTTFLHDGRAATVREAIRQHDGEGTKARLRFEALKPSEQQQLLAFLQSI
jgi:CxxC motif-containing protein (DUF1111 family)